MQLKALLLDLDGTLVDTAPDMVGTLNRVLENHGEQPVPESVAGKLVSNGARALLNYGFSTAPAKAALDEARAAVLVDEFLKTYAEHICVKSTVYDGMLDVLETCSSRGIRWGIVTNKPLELSRSLIDALGLLNDCSILLGGDSLPVRKPDPAPMLHCCMVLSLAASECLYIGDHERDISAGKHAGMDTGAALWGYIDEQQSPDTWGANYLINSPSGLKTIIHELLDR